MLFLLLFMGLRGLAQTGSGFDFLIKSGDITGGFGDSANKAKMLRLFMRRATALHITRFVVLDEAKKEITAFWYGHKGDTFHIVSPAGTDPLPIEKTGWVVLRGYSFDAQPFAKLDAALIRKVIYEVEDPK